MNLNPNNDSLSIVGKGAKFCGTVVGNDDCAGVALLLELISVYIGLHWMPIVYSNLTPRHNNYHRSWGMISAQEEDGRI